MGLRSENNACWAKLLVRWILPCHCFASCCSLLLIAGHFTCMWGLIHSRRVPPCPCKLFELFWWFPGGHIWPSLRLRVVSISSCVQLGAAITTDPGLLVKTEYWLLEHHQCADVQYTLMYHMLWKNLSNKSSSAAPRIIFQAVGLQ